MGWWRLMNFLKFKNLFVNHGEKGFTLCSFTDFQVLDPGLPTALDRGEIIAQSLRVFNGIFFAGGCTGVYPCMQNIPLSCKSSAFLRNSLHTTLHYVTKPDPTHTPNTGAREQFKYWLSPNGSEARTKQNFAGNGCGSHQVLLPQVTLNSLLKMCSFCYALMIAFGKTLYWRVKNKFKAHELIKILSL